MLNSLYPFLRTKLSTVVTILFCCFLFSGCLKEKRKYVGLYVGTERHARLEEGLGYVIDTTFHQEFDVSYYKRHYLFIEKFDNPYNSEFAIKTDEFEDGEYFPYSEGLYDSTGHYTATHIHLRFSHDSLIYIRWDYSENEYIDSMVFIGIRS